MADTPVVVQGTAVEAGNANQSPNHLGGEENGSKTSCNDPIFAALGYINLIAIAVVAGAFSDKVFTSNEDSGNVREYDGYIYAFIATSALSGVLSLLGMLFMMSFPTLIIKVALIFSVVMSAIMVVINVILQNYFGVIFSLIYLALVLCYARAVWARIPFATVNLVTSITAIRANFGIIFFAYGFAIMAFVWAFIWVVAFIGTYENNVECDEFGNCDEEPNPFAIIMLLLSFFFGQEILKVRQFAQFHRPACASRLQGSSGSGIVSAPSLADISHPPLHPLAHMPTAPSPTSFVLSTVPSHNVPSISSIAVI